MALLLAAVVPAFTPTLGQRLPAELARTVGQYQGNAHSFLKCLLGQIRPGINFAGGQVGQPQRFNIADWDSGRPIRITVNVQLYADLEGSNYGRSCRVPYITGINYKQIASEMASRTGWVVPFAMLDFLRADIAGRELVHNWYERLPEGDTRRTRSYLHAAHINSLLEVRAILCRNGSYVDVSGVNRPVDKRWISWR